MLTRQRIVTKRDREISPKSFDVLILYCSCGDEMHLIVNWTGPTPRGGVHCHRCNDILPMSE